MSNNLSAAEQKRLLELEEAFELFNQTSTQLTLAYEGLQNQVTVLQQQLAESNQEKRRVAERLEQLLNLLPAGVIVLDDKQKIIEMNPSAEGILGADAIDRDWDIVVRNVFLEHNDAGEFITHDKKAYQLSTSPLSMAQAENAEPNVGKILLIQDVTSAKELQSHVARHQRLDSMGEMAASLAHQIRTPLASALLYISQMHSSEMSAEQQEKFLGKSLKSLRHLEALVKDMLQYAKGGKVHNQTVFLDRVYENLQHSVEAHHKAQPKQVKFTQNLPGLALLGDQEAIQTALQNLIDNALEVSGERSVEVRMNLVTQDLVDIVVADQGPGIEQELQERIFEPFYTSRAKGTGLGLAVVRAVAEAHSGEAWVHSVKGRGAAFGMRLPVKQEESA